VILQYRRNAGPGTWGVRLTDGKDRVYRLATADDYAEADGREVLDFWQAQDEARAKAKEHAGIAAPATLAAALNAYEQDLRTRGGDPGNVTRVRSHLAADMLQRTVSSLTASELKHWRDRLAKNLAPSTVNRTTTCLKAALNLAADNDDRIARRPWETGLLALRDADRSRNVVLNDDQVRRVVAAAYGVGPEFGLLVETAAVTGARVSQLARLEVQDVQGDRGDPRVMMPSSRKGRGIKSIGRRPVPIPATLALRLRAIAGKRRPDAPLLLKPSSDAWRKSDHSRLFNRVICNLEDAKLADVTIYALRHSNVVRQLLADVPIRVVAVNHDTSVAMIERTYSRHIADHADALARRALLDLSAPAANVRPFGAKAGA
jgi:integrase